MKTQGRIAVFSLLMLFATSFVFSSGSSVYRYTENFTTKQYCDTLNTTALWDTVAGELELWPFELSLAGGYDTPYSAYNVVIAGNHAYVSDYDGGLMAVDISDPTAPTLAGSYNTPGAAREIDVEGDYAYVADNDQGLQVIDISNPSAPVLAGNYATPGYAYGVAVAGDYAYVADYTAGLTVVDISDPTTPALAGNYVTSSNAWGVGLSGDYAYVAISDSGLLAIDISDPTTPASAGKYVTGGSANRVTIAGDHAYVACMAAGLHIVDISDPNNLAPAGSYDTGYAYDVAMAGDFAYVADYESGVVVVDITDPATPSVVESFNTPGEALGVAVAGEYAFVADADSGLQVVDIADPTVPGLTASYATPGIFRGAAIAGDYAYAAESYGLKVVDIADPATPVLAGNYDTQSSAYDVAIAGDYAYMAVYSAGLLAVDIGDPTTPVLEASYVTTGYALGVSVAGDHAYVADGPYGLAVIDISDPATPAEIGNYDTPGWSEDVDVEGNYAFLADGSYGLQVFDISDPSLPGLAGSYDTQGTAYHVAVAGDLVYVADGGYGLLVIDISDPTTPASVGSYNTPGSAYGVVVDGDYAYVTDGTSGLQVIDVSDPANPALAGSHTTPEGTYGVAVAGDYVYVAEYYALEVIQVFERLLNVSENRGQSLVLNPDSTVIGTVRLSTSQIGDIQWEISADSGSTWQSVSPNGAWNILANPGSDLMWRSTHVYSTAQPSVNPTCDSLDIEWLFLYPYVVDIVDVPNDQGRQVSISWTRSGNDCYGSSVPVTEYAVYRKIDYGLSQMSGPDRAETRSAKDASAAGGAAPANPPGDWEFIVSVPTRAEDTYAAVVSTVEDSTIAEGMYYTTFFVSALTATPSIHFDSPPDSGYSVDNLSPHVPLGFTVAYNTGSGNQLAWDECIDEDFRDFRVYRGESEDFVPSPDNLVHETAGTDWLDTVDEGWRYFYKITAVDDNGNESDAASAGTATGAGTPEVPREFALHQNVPNPFNPATTIGFDLPKNAFVTLSIYSASGKLVRTLVDREMSPGRKQVSWDGRDAMGRSVASGIYFYRLDTPAYRQSRKMILLR